MKNMFSFKKNFYYEKDNILKCYLGILRQILPQ